MYCLIHGYFDGLYVQIQFTSIIDVKASLCDLGYNQSESGYQEKKPMANIQGELLVICITNAHLQKVFIISCYARTPLILR